MPPVVAPVFQRVLFSDDLPVFIEIPAPPQFAQRLLDTLGRVRRIKHLSQIAERLDRARIVLQVEDGRATLEKPMPLPVRVVVTGPVCSVLIGTLPLGSVACLSASRR